MHDHIWDWERSGMSISYAKIAGGRLSIHSLYRDSPGKRRQELSDLKEIGTILYCHRWSL